MIASAYSASATTWLCKGASSKSVVCLTGASCPAPRHEGQFTNRRRRPFPSVCRLRAIRSGSRDRWSVEQTRQSTVLEGTMRCVVNIGCSQKAAPERTRADSCMLPMVIDCTGCCGCSMHAISAQRHCSRSAPGSTLLWQTVCTHIAYEQAECVQYSHTGTT